MNASELSALLAIHLPTAVNLKRWISLGATFRRSTPHAMDSRPATYEAGWQHTPHLSDSDGAYDNYAITLWVVTL